MSTQSTVITCHHNADQDAVCSLIGALRLYPDAVLLFPGTQEKGLRGFYQDALQYLYPFIQPKELRPEEVTRLVITDTRQASRIPHAQALLEKPGISLHVWDHHPDTPDDVSAEFSRVEPVGSTCTLLAAEIARRGLPLGCEDASLLALGIYADTGCFVYNSTTEADFAVMPGLLAAGADLGLVSSMTRHDMTREQVMALNELLKSCQLHDLGGHTIALAQVQSTTYLNDFALLAHKFMEIQPCQVFFALGAMEDKIQVVARSRLDSVDVGALCAQLGGGGHRSAASASVRDKTLKEVKDALLTGISLMVNPHKSAGELMSSPAVGLASTDVIRQAEAVMGRYGLKALPVFRPGSRVCVGLMEHQLAVRAISHGLGEAAISQYMQGNFQVVPKSAGLQSLMDIIVGNRQRLVPVVGELPLPLPPEADMQDALKAQPIVGVVTRTDLIRIFMDEGGIVLPQPRQRKERERNVGRMMQVRCPQAHKLLVQAGELGSRLGLQVYVVGGFVRDLLIEQRQNPGACRDLDRDLDLVVEGNAGLFARALAEMWNGRVREHQEFLTALVIFTGEDGVERRMDVATARLEYYERPAALPTVELSSIKMDLDRRDFTINAMAVRLNSGNFGQLVDFFDGQHDIRSRRIRMLHALSFVEDPTRALRAVRFEQRFSFTIGPQCDRLIRNALEMGLMSQLSGGRIVHELEQILGEKDPMSCFTRMQSFGMLAAIHPLLELNDWKTDFLARGLDILDWYSKLYLDEPDSLKLFLLLMNRNAPVQDWQDLLERLALPESRREDMLLTRRQLVETLPAVEDWFAAQGKVSELAGILHNLGVEALLYLAVRVGDEELRKQLTLYIYKWRLEKPDINGEDLQRLGLAPGPDYGRILKAALAAKLDGIAPGRDAQLEYAAELAATARGRAES